MTEFYVCHFEDEPEKVSLYNLIEARLFSSGKFESCEIEPRGNGDTGYDIDVMISNNSHQIHYIIFPHISAMLDVVSEEKWANVIATIFDLDLGHGRPDGVAVARQLAAQSWPLQSSLSWILTGYPVETMRRLDDDGLTIAVIGKPANLRPIRDQIVDALFARLEV
ncbi:MAG: hypothetical protein WCO82_00395 [Sphingomonadales bacterium]|jgi:hypothetical protein